MNTSTSLTEPAPQPAASPQTWRDLAHGSAALPPWWSEKKARAWQRFTELPYPARTDEHWRFASVGSLKLDRFLPAEAASAADQSHALERSRPSFTASGALRFLNNRLLDSSKIPDDLRRQGVLWMPLEDAVKHHGDLLQKYFMAQPAQLGSEKFASLHAALCTAGSLLYVPRGVEIKEPLVAHHGVSGEGAGIFPHTLVVAEENARVTLVDFFFSLDSGQTHFSSGVNDLYAAPGAQLTYVAVQNWSPSSLSFQVNSTVVQRDARVLSLNLHLGGGQTRTESHSRLQGPGGQSEMLSLSLASGEQEFDQRTLQSHQAPNTRSNLLYKNALLDEARTIFSGLIVVDPDGQGTDAYQSNRNLLLSPAAEANALPGLEIMANNVRCTHGATTGRIEPEQLFYLQARGIPLRVAQQLLVFGFFDEVIEKLENSAVEETLRGFVRDKLKQP